MIIIPNIELFDILCEHFWHDALTKETVLKYVNVLEDRLGISSLNVDDRSLNSLRAALFRLKKQGLQA